MGHTWQWNIQAPGLSAVQRKVTLPPGGIVMVSRLDGLLCPSSNSGLIVRSSDVTSKLLCTNWNSCLLCVSLIR
jgi:hypothetical protein